jgi:hypothetical protein
MLYEKQNLCYIFPSCGIIGRDEDNWVLGLVAHNPRREFGVGEFFYFFSCNPLKSPDSTKEKQGMQAFLLVFIWIHLERTRALVE